MRLQKEKQSKQSILLLETRQDIVTNLHRSIMRTNRPKSCFAGSVMGRAHRPALVARSLAPVTGIHLGTANMPCIEKGTGSAAPLSSHWSEPLWRRVVGARVSPGGCSAQVGIKVGKFKATMIFLERWEVKGTKAQRASLGMRCGVLLGLRWAEQRSDWSGPLDVAFRSSIFTRMASREVPIRAAFLDVGARYGDSTRGVEACCAGTCIETCGSTKTSDLREN